MVWSFLLGCNIHFLFFLHFIPRPCLVPTLSKLTCFKLSSALKNGFIFIGRWHQNLWAWPHLSALYPKSQFTVPRTHGTYQSHQFPWKSSLKFWHWIQILCNFLLNTPFPLPFRSPQLQRTRNSIKKWITSMWCTPIKSQPSGGQGKKITSLRPDQAVVETQSQGGKKLLAYYILDTERTMQLGMCEAFLRCKIWIWLWKNSIHTCHMQGRSSFNCPFLEE